MKSKKILRNFFAAKFHIPHMILVLAKIKNISLCKTTKLFSVEVYFLCDNDIDLIFWSAMKFLGRLKNEIVFSQ
jgi:hypothetical protein